MSILEASTTELQQAHLDQAQLDTFKQGFRGRLMIPSDPGYDSARSIWNAMIDKKPSLIAQCTGTADVIQAVRFARQHDLCLAVRGGGHNVAGHALCDGGLVIDLSQMKGIHVDPDQRIARVQPGANLGDLDHETQAFGLAAPGGIVSDTGLSGLTLGGGFGWLSRKYGFTCDSLRSVDVITANGELLKASPTENADLFWGIRGGGGNFGIVTSFEFDLYPLGPLVLGGLILHPFEAAADVLRYYRQFSAGAPRELGSMAVFLTAPPAPFVPEPLRGKPALAIILCYAGDLDEGQKVLQPLREFGNPIVDAVKSRPFVDLNSFLDAGQPSGMQYYWKSEYVHDISDEAIETCIRYCAEITSPHTRVAFFQLGGAIQDLDEMDMAVGHRDAEYVLAINNGWKTPEDNEREMAWTRDFWTDMQPFSTGGVYVNFLSEDASQARVRAAYGDEKYERLVDLKDKYDPENVFRVNQNIQPSA